ncbi:MAG: helix-turn-helix domain-containing protein [Chitinispirillaceae bacterium]
MDKGHNFNDLLQKKMENPEFRDAWEEQQEEFEVAKEVIRLRLKAGLTQKELAKKAHTSQPAIARLESGNYQNVSMSFLRKVGHALGVEPHISFRRMKEAH